MINIFDMWASYQHMGNAISYAWSLVVHVLPNFCSSFKKALFMDSNTHNRTQILSTAGLSYLWPSGLTLSQDSSNSVKKSLVNSAQSSDVRTSFPSNFGFLRASLLPLREGSSPVVSGEFSRYQKCQDLGDYAGLGTDLALWRSIVLYNAALLSYIVAAVLTRLWLLKFGGEVVALISNVK